MKKLLAIFLALIMVFSSAACGEKKEADNPQKNAIEKLYDDGYEAIRTTLDEENFGAIFTKEGTYDSVFMATAPMNADLYSQFCELDWEETAVKNFICSLEGAEVKDITNLVPDEAKLAEFSGMTFGELEDMGYYNTGWLLYEAEEGGTRLTYDGPDYCLSCTIEGNMVIEDMDDYSANDLRALKIETAEFTGFGTEIFFH